MIFIFRNLREKEGLTQAQLAEKVGVVQSAISAWESGERFPRASKLPMIAETLNCTIDDLFKEEQEE